jgi:putative ABC transport system permease protein
MWKNSFKIAIRNIIRHRYYALINIAGLSIGLASFLLIMIYVIDELSYDRHHTHADSIYRIINVYDDQGVGEHSTGSPFPMAKALKKEYPELLKGVTRIFNFQKSKHVLTYDESKFEESLFYFADKSLFDVFDYTFVSGAPESSFTEPFSLLLTESTAHRYFGNEDPIGKKIKYEDRFEYTVTGILEDPPQQSHFRFDFLASFSSLDHHYPRGVKQFGWIWNPCWTYVLLKEGADPEDLSGTFPKFVQKHFYDENKDIISLYLQPLTDIHLKSHLDYEITQNSDFTNVIILALISVLILFAAVVNYVNLTTASGSNRANEIAMKKIIGAQKRQVLFQFLIESVLISLFALIVALAIVEIVMPNYGEITSKDFSEGIRLSPALIITILATGFITGIASGLYPAFYLSAFNPLEILRRKAILSRNGTLPRKLLVTFQYGISIILIITTLGIFKQYNYIKDHNLGFDYDNVLIINTGDSKVAMDYQRFRAKLKKYKSIEEVTGFNYVPGVEHNLHPYYPEGVVSENLPFFPAIQVREGFFETYKIPFLAGETIVEDTSECCETGIVINEAMVERLHWETAENAIGRKFTFQKSDKRVIGVTENFNVTSLHDTIVPFILDVQLYPGAKAYFTKFVAIRHAAGMEDEAIDAVRDEWYKIVEDRPFRYQTHVDYIKTMYQSEHILGKLLFFASLLSVFIATLGILGLTSYLTEQRTREIGIRKAMGALQWNIVKLFSGEYAGLIIVANLIAWPVAYLLVSFINQDFAYKASMGIWIFIAALVFAFISGGLMIGYQTIRASHKNPVDALRYE